MIETLTECSELMLRYLQTEVHPGITRNTTFCTSHVIRTVFNDSRGQERVCYLEPVQWLLDGWLWCGAVYYFEMDDTLFVHEW